MKMNLLNRMKQWVLILVVIATIGSTLLFLLHRFVCEINVVPTGSMLNTIEIDDLVCVNKLSYGAPLPANIAQVPILNLFEYVPCIKQAWSNWAKSKKRLAAIEKINRGDLAIFISPADSTVRLIKRVMALPGDTFQIMRGEVYINGIHQINPLLFIPITDTKKVPKAKFPNGTEWSVNDYGPLVIPADHYFMMGDNRSNTIDSRYFGYIARDAILGKGHVLTFLRGMRSVLVKH